MRTPPPALPVSPPGVPPDKETVTALLPVGPGTDLAHLHRALISLREQTHPPAATLIVANGVSDAEFAALNASLSSKSPPPDLRVLRLPRAHLAAALNTGLRESPTRLIARMDADDVSLPERLDRQVTVIQHDPTLAAVGCAWEVIGPDGTSRAIMRPATDPGRLAWTLLLGNSLAHGSMLLDRLAVLAVGGYDESLDRAQDYDLWLRLTRAGRRLAAVPNVLYRYTERTEPGVAASSLTQAAAAADAMLSAWAHLPIASGTDRASLAAIVASAMTLEHGGDVLERLESLLDLGPSREALTALLWARDRFPPLRRGAIEASRRALVREVASRIRAAGATSIWLWGAGRHTASLLEHASDLGLPIAGIADDHAFGQHRLGFEIVHPRDIPAGAHALLSSDWHEQEMWAATRPHRDRGVHVWRLYA